MVEEIIKLLNDPDFKLWVQFPNETSDKFWSQIMQKHPTRTESIHKARVIMEAINKEFEVHLPDPETVERVLRKIFA